MKYLCSSKPGGAEVLPFIALVGLETMTWLWRPLSHEDSEPGGGHARLYLSYLPLCVGSV